MKNSFATKAVCLAFLMVLNSCDTAQFKKEVREIMGSTSEGLTLDTIVAGLKEALTVGINKTVDQTSQQGGYFNNKEIFIPVPESLEKVANSMRKIGMGSMVDNFEAKMNEAAEHASSQAIPVFVDAITQISFQDAKSILYGKETAATDYFREKTQLSLQELYAPIVENHLRQIGTIDAFHALMDKYEQLPFAPKLEYNLEEYVVGKALDGLFIVLAKEERKIRKNPAARTTELLRKVFK